MPLILVATILLAILIVWLASARFFAKIGIWITEKLFKPFKDALGAKGEGKK